MYRLFRRAAALIFAAVMTVCADPTAVEYNGISAMCGYADFANQSSTILKLCKYFLVKLIQMRYNNINKSAFELDKE